MSDREVPARSASRSGDKSLYGPILDAATARSREPLIGHRRTRGLLPVCIARVEPTPPVGERPLIVGL